jgi:actin-related protein 8
LNTTFDWRLAELLKEKWCTMNEADISVQVYDFFARTPFKPTLKYQCKVYDEVFLAPLCLVYPDILKQKNKKYAWLNKNVTDDTIEDLNNVSFIITKKSLILTYCD